MSTLVQSATQDRVALVTLNRPDRRNALSSDMRTALYQRLEQAEADDQVDVVVITGADPAFCAGLDLAEMAASGLTLGPGDGPPWPPRSKPLIGAINGPAVTGGLELALACDFLVASERARFADTHTRVGLIPFWGLSVCLPEAIGLRRAREMSLTGNFIDADQALQWGLVNRVVPHDQLVAVALGLAADVVSADQPATRALVAAYAGFSGGGPEAARAEVATAEAFLGGGVDPAVIEARRLAVLERSRQQRG